MSNAFSGQRQFAQSPMMGGYGGGYGGGMGGYGSPFGGGMGGYGGGFDASRDFSGMGGFGGFGGGMGGYGTQFGGYGMGGGGGGFGGYQQPSLMPAYQPTINDAFSNYFSQQYYGGPAFNPFAATSMFGGGGYGGGFGGGRRGGGRRGSARQNPRQMFEDYFQPEQLDQARPQPMPPTTPQPSEPMMYAGGNPNFDMTGARDQMAFGYGNAPLSHRYGGSHGELESEPYRPGPYDQKPQPMLPTPVEGGIDSIMPMPMQDTPVQSAEYPFSRSGRDMFMGGYGFRMR